MGGGWFIPTYLTAYGVQRGRSARQTITMPWTCSREGATDCFLPPAPSLHTQDIGCHFPFDCPLLLSLTPSLHRVISHRAGSMQLTYRQAVFGSGKVKISGCSCKPQLSVMSFSNRKTAMVPDGADRTPYKKKKKPPNWRHLLPRGRQLGLGTTKLYYSP
jgi:hypothetical protein